MPKSAGPDPLFPRRAAPMLLCLRWMPRRARPRPASAWLRAGADIWRNDYISDDANGIAFFGTTVFAVGVAPGADERDKNTAVLEQEVKTVAYKVDYSGKNEPASAKIDLENLLQYLSREEVKEGVVNKTPFEPFSSPTPEQQRVYDGARTRDCLFVFRQHSGHEVGLAIQAAPTTWTSYCPGSPSRCSRRQNKFHKAAGLC